LQDIRHARADAAFQAFEFGPDVTVHAANGWEFLSPGREMSRKVFFSSDDDAKEADSRVLNFTVAFADDWSPVVVGAHALTATGGNLVGEMPPKVLEDEVNDKMAELAAALLGQQLPVASASKAPTAEFLMRMRRSGRGPAA